MEQRVSQASENGFQLGRQSAEDELGMENRRLREVIDGMRQEMSGKQKRLIELQFEYEELSKSKKRLQGEMEEMQMRINRERDGQREM